MHYVFKALASDLITFYSFDKCLNLLDAPDFGKASFDTTDKFFLMTHIGKVLPWLMGVFTTAPNWLVRIFFPDLFDMRERRNVGHDHPLVHRLSSFFCTRFPSGLLIL